MEPNYHHIIFAGSEIQFTAYNGRCWVSLTSLCASAKIDVLHQVRRLQRHARVSNLNLLVHQYSGATTIFMPLEELQWFLRSLRPQVKDAKRRTVALREGLFWRLLEVWVEKNGGRYGSERLVRDMDRKAAALKGRQAPPSASRCQFKPGDTARIFQYRQSGLTHREIGDIMGGASASTICQIANGKYPVDFESTGGVATLGLGKKPF